MAYTFEVKAGRPAGDPRELERRREALAEMLANSAGDTGPIHHPLQGVARMADALVKGLAYRKAGRQLSEGRAGAQKGFNKIFGDILAGGGGGNRRVPSRQRTGAVDVGGGNYAAAASPESGIGNYADAISSIESSGRYDALGPVTKNNDRAYGKYQVMGNNIGPWTQEILGVQLTPQQFLENPEAQDQVFNAKFGQYVDQYGNPQDAASMWFTGKPLAQGAGLSDQLGTTGQAYVDKFTTALGQPTQVASLDPAAGIPAAQPNPQLPAGAAQQPAVMTTDAMQAATTPQAPQQPVQMAQAGVNTQAIMEAMQDPFLPDAQRAMLGKLLMRQLPPTQQQQLEMQLQQQELENLRNPQMSPYEEAQTELGQDRLGLDESRLGLDERRLKFDQEKARLTDDLNEYDRYYEQETAAGREPMGVYDFITGVRQANQPPAGETEFSKQMGRTFADQNKQIIEAGRGAQSRIATLDQMQQAMRGADTGFGAETMLQLRRVGKALGMETEDLSDEEFIQAAGNRMALELRSPSGGAGMPGAMSDKDREFLVASVPGLSKTPGGNRKLIDYMKRMEKRNMEVAALARQYRVRNNGQLNDGFFQELAQFSAANPMFEGESVSETVATPAPSGVEQDLWDLMTPEERALWQN